MQQFADYVRNGWALCAIPPGHKGPLGKGWQKREQAIRDPATAEHLPGVGLLHAYSGTCCLDIDDFVQAAAWLFDHGIDLHALWHAQDAVRITSGRPNRGKLLYANPYSDKPLISKKVIEPIDGKDANIIDFRCASRSGTSLQDVLPGTVHPTTGKPYEWEYANPIIGDWRSLPTLPDAVWELWQKLAEGAAVDETAAPAAPTGATAEKIRAVLARKDPDCDRDTWVKVLSTLHHETQGSEEGLALANEWSARGKKYAGFEDVATRWRSFSLKHPAPATMERDIDSLPATAEEFPPIAPPSAAELAARALADEAQRREENKLAKKTAIETLEKTLVFVSTLDKYFDTEKRIALAGDHAIKHIYTAKMPYIRTPTGRVKANPVKILEESQTKRIVDMPGFHPGAGLFFVEDGVHYVNEYIADAVPPLKPTVAELEKIQWLFNRIDDPVFREWLRKFYGHAIQRPGVKIFSAPLIWSETTGNGKSTLLQEIPQLLFGLRYSQSVSNSQLASDHNDYLVGKWFIHLSEMHADAKNERNAITSKLKAWITDALSINPKGTRGYTTRNCLVVTAASNKNDAAAIENEDRRWGIHELRAAQMTKEEGIWLHDEFLKTDRAAGVLRHYFLNVDINGFVATAPAPHTKSRDDMIAASAAQDVSIILEAIEDQRGPFALDIASPQQVMAFLREEGVRNLSSPVRLNHLMAAAPIGCVQIRPNVPGNSGTKQRLWVCRNKADWLKAPAKSVFSYWAGDADPLTG